MPPEITIYDGRRTRAWWDGGAFSSRCRGCDGGGSFSMGYCGEPHLREPCYDCDSTGFREHSWAAIRRARRKRRRELLRETRQRLRLRSGARLRRRLADAAARLLGPCWCELDAMLVDGVLYEDGQVIACPDCGYLWSVSCDSETAPHLIDCGIGFADEGERDHG